MLLDRYEHLFFNANFKEAGPAGYAAYRGELIIKEGEIADAQGRRKPPVEVLKQAILLSCGDELKLVAGSLDELQHFPSFVENFAADLKAGTLLVLFTVNIDKAFVAAVNGAKAVFIPLVQGMVWTELTEMVGLEKGDFKGQGAAEKVVTLCDALKAEKFAYPEVGVDEAMKSTNNAKRENHGAV